MRGQACEPAAYQVRHTNVLRDRDGGGFGKPFAVRRSTVRPARQRCEDPLGPLSEDAGPWIRGRGEATDPARNLFAERGILRCVLQEGAAGTNVVDSRLSGSIC